MKIFSLAAVALFAVVCAAPASAASIITVKTVKLAHQTGAAATSLTKTELGTIRSTMASSAGTTTNLNILPNAFTGQLGDWTATLFSGTLNVAVANNYAFNLNLLKNVSGGWLKVDNNRINLSSFNLGGTNTGYASTTLSKGAHTFEAFFVKKGGAAHGGFTGLASGTSAASLTFSPLVSAVPEPASWALMMVGFGMVGGAARYRRRSTTVTYA